MFEGMVLQGMQAWPEARFVPPVASLFASLSRLPRMVHGGRHAPSSFWSSATGWQAQSTSIKSK